MRKQIIILLVTAFVCIAATTVYAELPARVQTMVKDGQTQIENGKYQEAVSSLGQILSLLGGSTTDPEVDALGATIQAYGLSHSGDSYIPMAKQFLERAIAKDPKWGYPKTLLLELEKK